VTGFGASPAAAFDLLWGLELVEVGWPDRAANGRIGPAAVAMPAQIHREHHVARGEVPGLRAKCERLQHRP
jgi:hypothetical protein